VENQPRTGLPHRPDQPGAVHKFITSGSEEEKIDQMIRERKPPLPKTIIAAARVG